MRVRGLLYVLCVFFVACVFRVEGLSSEEEGIVRSAVKSEPRMFYIYPRSGRLFHADYVRDNEIFRSLERTNFMRRGPFADAVELKRSKRASKEEAALKKHTYVNTGRIPVGKKGLPGKIREAPFKVLTKLSDFITPDSRGIRKRTKREPTGSDGFGEDKPVTTLQDSGMTSSILKEKTVLDVDSVNPKENYSSVSKVNTTKESVSKEKENKVEEDHNTHTIDSDTDKTLFVLDSVQQNNKDSGKFQVPELSILQEDLMKKLVLDDGMSLYPVYTGVKYTYPRTQRSLLYAPEMAVQMDSPEVTDFVGVTRSNSTSDYEEEGRGRRRRRIKKLAFPLLLALKLKAAVMLPLILGLISLVAFKGLWSGLTALGVAAALGLKALVGGSAPRVVVQAPPHYHHLPPHEYAEYWSRRDDFTDYRPSSWS